MNGLGRLRFAIGRDPEDATLSSTPNAFGMRASFT